MVTKLVTLTKFDSPEETSFSHNGSFLTVIYHCAEAVIYSSLFVQSQIHL